MNTSKPWLNLYTPGVPANIDADKYPTLIAFVNEHFKKYAKMPAYYCMGKSLTFKQIDQYSEQFGAYLQARGLEPGDRIALMMPNMLQYPICLFGALRAGLIIVNTNPLYTPREMKHQFTDSGTKAIVICENFAYNLEKVLPETNIKTIITTSIGGMLGGMKGWFVNFAVRRIKRMVPKYNLPNAVAFKDALKGGKKFKLNTPESSPNDTIIFQYTGGTTGLSKGAMLTNRNLIANMLQMGAILTPYMEEGKEVALCALPLYHIYALTVNCLGMLVVGGQNVLVTNARDISSIVKEFKRHPFTLVTGVNTLFNAMLNDPSFQKLDFSSLKITSGGGMAVQKSVAERWLQTTGCFLAEGYGMTESSPCASCNPFDGKGRIGYIGLPLPSTDMRIVDEQGQPLAPNEIGEIQIKGPQVMKGYYNQPEATAKALVDGWLNTGDIGLMVEDGFFKIVDRKKDMILVSGFNVFPNEVEDALADNPRILEVAAIGIPSETSTEAVKVFIVKKDKSLTEKEVKEYAREVLTGYKRPKEIEFRKELPKTNVGKILRRALKEEEMAKRKA